jgi:hypothetical protein
VAFSNGQNVQAADLNNFSVTTITTTGDVSVGGALSAASAAVTGALTVASKGVLGEAVVALTDGANVAIDASLGSVFTLTAGGNRTILAPTNATSGQKIIIRHLASGADRTLSLTTGSAGAFRFGTDITALTATTSAKTDYIGCVYNAADSRWDVVAVSKGF